MDNNALKELIKARIKTEYSKYKNSEGIDFVEMAAFKLSVEISDASGWISVSERLPDFKIDDDGDKQYPNVLASNGNSVYIASCEYWETPKGGEWHMYGDYGTTTVEVTHWQPLPSPPKQQQHG